MRLSQGRRLAYQGAMRRLFLCLSLTLAACTPPPPVRFPAGPVSEAPGLLPLEALSAPDPSPDPGPALQARATALRTGLGF